MVKFGMPHDSAQALIARLVLRGQEAHRVGNHTEEVEVWKQVAVLEPKNPYWQVNLAHAFALIGSTEQAVVLFRFVIEVAPSVSQAYNNYAGLLAENGVPVNELFALFVYAVETSETYAHFQRHFANVCASVALGDVAPHEDFWLNIQECAGAFLDRVNDKTPEHVAYVKSTVQHFRNYELFKLHLAAQDWTAASKVLDKLEVDFVDWEFGEVEIARIRRFRPQIICAADLFAILSRLASGQPFSPDQLKHSCTVLLGQYGAVLSHVTRTGNVTFLDLLGWCAAELKRQVSWLVEPGSKYDADSHRVPNNIFRYLSGTRYFELAEMFQGLLLQVNRILRRASEQYQVMRGSDQRTAVVEKAWLSIRVAAHGSVAEYSGLNEVIGREMLGWNTTSLDRVRRDIQRFRDFVESQAHMDMYVHGRPQEGVGRALLQAFLSNNGFREVPVRGGRVDVLVVRRDAAFIIETKIWRGPAYHDDGLRELEEYISNNSIPDFAGAFYIVFDPTVSRRAAAYHSDALHKLPGVETVIVSIALPTPSKKGVAERSASSPDQ